MIRISANSQTEAQFLARAFLEEQVIKGVCSKRHDDAYGMNLGFVFHNPEDETAFILKFGDNLAFKLSAYFYCPYIPPKFQK